jgi:hypothetical protein
MLSFPQFVWFCSSLIEGMILVRSIERKSFAKYSLFYAYIFFLLGMSLFLRIASTSIPSLFVRFYLPLEFVNSALGCGVIFEIIRHAFAGHENLKRLARRAAALVFGMIFLELGVLSLLLLRWNPAKYQIHLGRDLLLAQAAGLIAIILLTGYYGIEVGRNMRGIILGFGVYLGAILICPPLRVFFDGQFSLAWRIVQISAYLAALSIWAVALWNYEADAGASL